MPDQRKRTVFQLCTLHGWLASESRERRAEFFAEGGPTDGPCAIASSCKIRPGTDLFVADTARGEHPFRWAANP